MSPTIIREETWKPKNIAILYCYRTHTSLFQHLHPGRQNIVAPTSGRGGE